MSDVNFGVSSLFKTAHALSLSKLFKLFKDNKCDLHFYTYSLSKINVKRI